MGALPGSDALLTIAEVHIALAAASGIILAPTRDPERWSTFDAQQRFLLSLAVPMAVISLLNLGAQSLNALAIGFDGLKRLD